MPTDKIEKESKSAAAEAVELEKAVNSEPDTTTYVHEFRKPFSWEGNSYEKLTFQWGALTGADYLNIESELLAKGKTLIVPAYTGEFLCSMAVRACAEKKPDGVRALDAYAVRALPMRDYMAICQRAQSFLLHAES